MIGSRWIAAAVEPVINAAIALDEQAGARIDRLGAKVLELRVTGLGLSLFIVPAGDRLRISHEIESQPDACISGPPASLLRLSTTSGTRVLFGDAVRVQGKVSVANAYKRLFDTLEPDWEEALARVSGDVPAHEAASALRAFAQAAQRATDGRTRDLRAWLIDEIEALPGRGETEAWLLGVARLRADADRLKARLDRLERRTKEPPQ